MYLFLKHKLISYLLILIFVAVGFAVWSEYLTGSASAQNFENESFPKLRNEKATEQLMSASEYESLKEEITKQNFGLPTNEQAKLIANDGRLESQFGESVAISGNIAVVGSRLDDPNQQDQGSVYIFARNGGNWTQQQKLIAADGERFDFFGSSVAISGDTIVVGASSNTFCGAAYVYVQNGTNWVLQQKLVASDRGSNDFFGNSVAILDNTIIIGASGDDINNVTNQGSAYIFTRNGQTWTVQTKLTESANGVGHLDACGSSVAISENYAVIGCPGWDIDDVNLVNVGSAVTFVRNGTSWSQGVRFFDFDQPQRNASFGSGVAVTENTAIVGIPGFNDSQGRAIVYSLSSSGPSISQRLTADDAAANQQFGSSVAIQGDVAVIGADLANIGTASGQGTSYIFTRSENSWQQQQKFVASDGFVGDRLGHSVALSGNTVISGAYNDDIDSKPNQGSAYIFRVLTASPIPLVVTNTNDSGNGSLRQAIITANSNNQSDTINFNIPANSSGCVGSACTIILASEIIPKADGGNPMTIDGSGVNAITLSGNNATRLFGIFSNVKVSMSNLTITGGNGASSQSPGFGGAFYLNGSINGSSANSQLTLNNVTLNDNNTSGAGGAINANFNSTLIMTNVTVSNNSCGNGGSGIAIFSAATMTNVTVSGNTTSGNGGGIFVGGAASTLTATSLTVTNNSAGFFGAGINNSNGGTTNIRNSIIAGNTFSDVSGTFNSQGYNFIGKNGSSNFVAGSPNAGNDIVGTNTAPLNPQLQTLAGNGGLTRTHALSNTSPALDKGNSFGTTTDQRGVTRPVDFPGIVNASGGDGADIGAFEIQTTNPPPSLTVINTNNSGVGSLRQAIINATSNNQPDTIDFNIPNSDSGCISDTCTIRLTSGELAVNRDTNNSTNTLTIDASASVNRIAISGNNQSRIFFTNTGAALTLNTVTVTNGNSAGMFSGSGGGIYNNSGTLAIINSSIDGNRSTNSGGGIENRGAMTVTNSIISNNQGASGGIESYQGSLTVTNSIISNNTAQVSGGGILATLSIVALINSTIIGNSAPGGGAGGVDNFSSTLDITKSTINNNTAEIGGGMWLLGNHITTVTNSTISGNEAQQGSDMSGGIGGGIYTQNGALIVTNSTISDNTAQVSGGGINTFFMNSSGSTHIRNSIIAGNTASSGQPDINHGTVDTFSSLGNNLIGNAVDTGNPITWQSSDMLNQSPALAPLGNYGGQTQTHALLSNSPAINAGNNCVLNSSCASNNPPSNLTTDQRGVMRPFNITVDIGAFELSGEDNMPYTPTGNNVIVQTPSGDARVTFAQVTTAGTTTFTPITPPSSAGTPPSGYTILENAPAYDITTTASYTLPVTVCFTVSSITSETEFARVRILHGENGQLIDRTILAPDSPAPDFAARAVCARVNSLSPFVVALAPPAASYTITGTVSYGTTPVGDPAKYVPGVTLNAAGTPPASTTSATNGSYSLNGLGAGSYTVTPSKSAQTNNTGISLQDASEVAKYVFNQRTFTPSQLIAADATGNGSVSLQDASEIAKRAFNIAGTNIVGQWKFVPASRNYPSSSSNLTGENYEAILVGDVTGNWTPPNNNPTALKSESEILEADKAVSIAEPQEQQSSGLNNSMPNIFFKLFLSALAKCLG